MILMRAVDLTWPIRAGMAVFPGDTAPVISDEALYEREGFRQKRLELSTHTGTHVDAPAHLTRDGAALDKLPPESFFGMAAVADVRGRDGHNIEFSELGVSDDALASVDFLLLRTGWDAKFVSDDYFLDYPVLSEEAARKLAGIGLKGIGVDAPSFDPVEGDCPRHKLLLGAGLLLIENLRGLEALPNGPFCLTALPLSVADADGAPARVVAVLEK